MNANKTLESLKEVYRFTRSVYYAGNQRHCPCCEWQFRTFLPYNQRQNAKCPRCGALERHRLYAIFLKENADLLRRDSAVLPFAPTPILERQFAKLPNWNYITTDFLTPNVHLTMDIMRTSFADDTFDLVICNHVMEHIPDDLQALRELHRIIKADGGVALIQVPLDHEREITFEDPTITSPEERLRLFGQDDHVRVYGRDFADRLKMAGFKFHTFDYQTILTSADLSRYGLNFSAGRVDDIYICTKQ